MIVGERPYRLSQVTNTVCCLQTKADFRHSIFYLSTILCSISYRTSGKNFPVIWHFYVGTKLCFSLVVASFPWCYVLELWEAQTLPSFLRLLLPGILSQQWERQLMLTGSNTTARHSLFCKGKTQYGQPSLPPVQTKHLRDAIHREQCPLCVLADRATLGTPANLWTINRSIKRT